MVSSLLIAPRFTSSTNGGSWRGKTQTQMWVICYPADNLTYLYRHKSYCSSRKEAGDRAVPSPDWWSRVCSPWQSVFQPQLQWMDRCTSHLWLHDKEWEEIYWFYNRNRGKRISCVWKNPPVALMVSPGTSGTSSSGVALCTSLNTCYTTIFTVHQHEVDRIKKIVINSTDFKF